jgi:hypothetical protein
MCVQQRKEAPYTREKSAYGGHYRGLWVLEDVVEERYHTTKKPTESPHDYRAGVIVTHAPSTSDACETHVRPVGGEVRFQSGPVERLERQRALWQRGQRHRQQANSKIIGNGNASTVRAVFVHYRA